MKKYKDLDIGPISYGLDRAEALINGRDVFDGVDYIGSVTDPKEQIEGYKIISELYEQLKVYEAEVECEKGRMLSFFHSDIRLQTLDRVFVLYHALTKYAAPNIKNNKLGIQGKSNNIRKENALFTKPLNIKQRKYLYEELMKGQYIPENTDFINFCHVFGGGDRPDHFEPLIWTGLSQSPKQLLRELLIPLIHPEIKLVDMENLVPSYFSYKGKPMKLAKDKKVFTQDSDNIKTILHNLATM